VLKAPLLQVVQALAFCLALVTVMHLSGKRLAMLEETGNISALERTEGKSDA